MAINLDEIERGYAEAMLKKYSRQLEAFKHAFENEATQVGGMYIQMHKSGAITLIPGFGPNNSHNVCNDDARNILNIIRMSIEDRIKKFENKDEES